MDPVLNYFANLSATLTTATLTGVTAGHYLPHPYAVIVVIGSITAIVCAPFITPIRQEEP